MIAGHQEFLADRGQAPRLDLTRLLAHGLDFSHHNLALGDLTGADLRGSNFRGSDLSNTGLFAANMDDAR
jgi:Uncharacterized low-complexity proteins